MTRAEAEKLMNDNIWNSPNSHTGQKWIDFFVSLGMLKLEEPKLCKEDEDWDWWLRQSSEFKGKTVKFLRGMYEGKL